jgi:hypothetical protein
MTTPAHGKFRARKTGTSHLPKEIDTVYLDRHDRKTADIEEEAGVH